VAEHGEALATFALIGGVIRPMEFFKVGAVKTALSGAAAQG
jgi:hypothetical protein